MGRGGGGEGGEGDDNCARSKSHPEAGHGFGVETECCMEASGRLSREIEMEKGRKNCVCRNRTEWCISGAGEMNIICSLFFKR